MCICLHVFIIWITAVSENKPFIYLFIYLHCAWERVSVCLLWLYLQADGFTHLNIVCYRLKTPPRPQGQRTEPESRGVSVLTSLWCGYECINNVIMWSLSLNSFRVLATQGFTCRLESVLFRSVSSPQSLTPTTPSTDQASVALSSWDAPVTGVTTWHWRIWELL